MINIRKFIEFTSRSDRGRTIYCFYYFYCFVACGLLSALIPQGLKLPELGNSPPKPPVHGRAVSISIVNPKT